MIGGTLKDGRFYAGIVVALVALYAWQYFRAKRGTS